MHLTNQYNRPAWGVPGHHVQEMPSPMAWACQPQSGRSPLQQANAEGGIYSSYEQGDWTCVSVGAPDQPFGALQWAQALGGDSIQVSFQLLPSGAQNHGFCHVKRMPNSSSPSSCSSASWTCQGLPARGTVAAALIAIVIVREARLSSWYVLDEEDCTCRNAPSRIEKKSLPSLRTWSGLRKYSPHSKKEL
eukprot:5072225-Pleurochrysis_carterae.AAC.5